MRGKGQFEHYPLWSNILHRSKLVAAPRTTPEPLQLHEPFPTFIGSTPCYFYQPSELPRLRSSGSAFFMESAPPLCGVRIPAVCSVPWGLLGSLAPLERGKGVGQQERVDQHGFGLRRA